MSRRGEIREESDKNLTSLPRVVRSPTPGVVVDADREVGSNWEPEFDEERVIMFVDIRSGHIVGCVDEGPEDEALATRDFIEKYQKYYNLTFDEDEGSDV